jgi:ABC-type phosphate transport system substrate-binding protein
MKYLFLVVLISFIFLPVLAQGDILIITNKNVAVDTLSKSELKEIFLGSRIKWKDNKSVHFAISGDESMHSEFLKTYINRSESQFKRHWKKMVFTGKGEKPKTFKTKEELLEYVSKTDGAIGYIDDNTVAVNVKTIKLQ